MLPQMNGPQRGRRSQHQSRNSKSAGGNSRQVRGQAETELGAASGAVDYPSSTPSSPHPNKTGAGGDPNALESGFFNNKYAVNEDQQDVRNKIDPVDPNNKPVRKKIRFQSLPQPQLSLKVTT